MAYRARLLPWGVLALAIWIVAGPLLNASDQVFGLLAGDGIRAAWYLDFVSRNLGSLERLHGFDWPAPVLRELEFSTAVDAVLLAPAAWAWSWPGQWGVAQAVVLATNGFAVAWLARAMGCRGFGIAVAGVLGLCSVQVLKELHMGRINAAWVGLSVAALAAWLEVWTHRARWAIAAGVLGALAAAVYPPFLLFLAPVAIWMAKERWGDTEARGRWAALGSLVLGGVLVAPEVGRMLRSPRAQLDGIAPSVTQGIGMHLGGDNHVAMVLQAGDWLSWHPPQGGAGIAPGVAVGAWAAGLLLLPLVRSARLGVIWATVGVLGGLSLGPSGPFSWLGAGVWGVLGVVHDFGRFATVAGVWAAVATGLSFEVAFERGRRRLRQLVLGVCVLAMAQALSVSVGAIRAPERWSRAPELVSTAELRSAAPKVTVELPYGDRLLFLSALQAPGSLRVNPISDERPDKRGGIVIPWFAALGHGDIVQPAPDLGAVRAAGVERVVFDANRCGRPFSNEKPRVYPWPSEVPQRACGDAIMEALVSSLGPFQQPAEGLYIWEWE